MKNIFILALSFFFLLLVMLSGVEAFAQVPQKFNYQGIARDAKGNPMAKQSLALKLSVLPTSDAITAEYEEVQYVATNEFGLYTLQIGAGTPLIGDMKTVKWETGNKYIKVMIDPTGGNDFKDAGTSQLLSVPYAIYADKAGMAKNTSGDRTGTVSSNAVHVAGDTNFLTKFTGLNVIGKSQVLDNGTNVGIGITNPLFKLHIQKPTGNADILVRTLDTVGAASLRLRNSAGAELGINKFGPNATGNFMGIPRANMAAVNNFTTGPFVFNSGSDIVFGNTVGPTQVPRMFVSGATGNVGIGTLTPNAKLEVDGQLKITGGNPAKGKILTTDSTGLATWQMPGTDSQWANNGPHIFNNNNGNVGIGTNTPKARFHVVDSSVVFSANGDTSIITFNNPPPIQGQGRRMMWYSERGAFRAGGLAGSDSLNWNRDSIGAYSIAIGWNTKATGRSAIAMGDNTTAIGFASTAMGLNTIAAGSFSSTALGENTNAIGDVSTAMGLFTTASGSASTSMGFITTARGTSSTSMGSGTIASGQNSTAMGNGTLANGFSSLVLGQFNDSIVASQSTIEPNTPLFIIGNGASTSVRANAMVVRKDGKIGIGISLPVARLHVADSSVVFSAFGDTSNITFMTKPPIEGAGRRMMWYPERGAFRAGGISTIDSLNWNRDSIGAYSIALGWNTKAKGRSAVAMGDNTTASGSRSTAMGNGTIASGFNSTAMGDVTVASGTGSTAIGFSSTSSGLNSVAMGNNTTSIGDFSTSSGIGTTANGDRSFAMCNNTTANGFASTAMGSSTSANGGRSTSMGTLTIANGFCSLVIGQFNDSIVASQSSMLSTTPLFIVGNGTASNARSNAFVVRNDGRVGIGTSTPTNQLTLSTNSAAKPTSSSWTISSDARLKTVDGNYTRGLEDILKLNTISYHYNKGNARNLPTEEQGYGFVAQELQQVYPEAVKQNEDGYLSVDFHPVLVSYINAFKELNTKIEVLEKENSKIELLKKQNESLQQQIDELKSIIKK